MPGARVGRGKPYKDVPPLWEQQVVHGNEEKLVTKHFMYMSLDKYIFYPVCVTRVPCAELLHEIRDSTLLRGLLAWTSVYIIHHIHPEHI